MPRIDRRTFFSAAFTGAAAWSYASRAWAAEPTTGTVTIPTGLPVSGPDTLFLTWQSDPTTTMTVQWVGPEPTIAEPIQYATVENPVWRVAQIFLKPYPNTDLKVHRCELTGLKPGTEYQFQIGNAEPTFRFRTMPAKATDTISFVSGGDAGVDLHAINSNVLAAKQEPYFALIAGDLAYDNGRAPATFTKFLQNYRAHMVDAKGRLIPLLSCIGNHEVDGGYRGLRAKSPQYLSVFDGMFSEKTFGVLDIGDYLSLVLLDTGHIEPIDGEQTTWLEKTLADRQSRPHLIVANHVPAYPSYRTAAGEKLESGTGAEQRKHWCPLFERYNVDVVLEHHDHTFKRTYPLINGQKDRNGVVYLGDGSWGKLRVPKKPEERPYLAAVSPAYHVTVHRLEGDQRFHVALEESGKIADVCVTTSKRAASRSS